MSSEPVKRTIKVLEFLANRGSGSVSLIDIARQCDIAVATLSRIISTLEEEGYVQRKGRREYVANFQLKKLLPMSENYLVRLDEVLHDIAQQTQQSAEAILLENDELLWHSKVEFEDMAIRLRAHPGFRRGLYELDAPSRHILHSMGWEQIEAKFEINAFFSTGLQRQFLAPADVRTLVNGTDISGVEYDLEGNNRGIRRFTKLIHDRDGNAVHLISIAEAAVGKTDIRAHVENNVGILIKAANLLEKQLG